MLDCTESSISPRAKEGMLSITMICCERSEQSLLRVKGPDKQLQTVGAQIVSVNFLNALHLPSFSPFLPSRIS